MAELVPTRILAVLERAPGPLTMREILARMNDPSLSGPTVTKALNNLKARGAVESVPMPEVTRRALLWKLAGQRQHTPLATRLRAAFRLDEYGNLMIARGRMRIVVPADIVHELRAFLVTAPIEAAHSESTVPWGQRIRHILARP